MELIVTICHMRPSSSLLRISHAHVAERFGVGAIRPTLVAAPAWLLTITLDLLLAACLAGSPDSLALIHGELKQAFRNTTGILAGIGNGKRLIDRSPGTDGTGCYPSCGSQPHVRCGVRRELGAPLWTIHRNASEITKRQGKIGDNLLIY